MTTDQWFSKHFIQRAWERYHLVLDSAVTRALATSLSTQEETTEQLFVGNRRDTEQSHQQIWWVRIQGTWVRAVFDTKRIHLVTALPPDDTMEYFTGETTPSGVRTV